MGRPRSPDAFHEKHHQQSENDQKDKAILRHPDATTASNKKLQDANISHMLDMTIQLLSYKDILKSKIHWAVQRFAAHGNQALISLI